MKIKNIIMAGFALVASLAFTACQTEWPDTNPLNKQDVNVVAYGPNPVARGGELRFVGTGLDQIKSVTLPGCGDVTEIEVKSANDIRIVVPQNAEPGEVKLTTKANKEIVCEKLLAYTEPVAFAAEGAFAPNPVKAGQVLTIKGDYLNLVQTVILSDGVEVSSFKSQTREEISLVVPAEAQTGFVTLSFVATGDTIANLIKSKIKLDVVLPSVSEIVALDEKKPGDEITLAGKDFDLITKVYSTQGEEVEFQATETSLTFKLPEVIVDGVINVEAASGVKVAVATIGVALPKVTAVSPVEGLRAGDLITITGKDFDIVSNVTFPIAGDKTVDADVVSKTATEVKVALPDAAITGAFKLNTTAGVVIDDAKLAYTTLKPVFASFEPASAPMGSNVVANGQNMDLVVKVIVAGGAVLEATSTETTATFTLPYANAETGKVTLQMANGETVESTTALEITAPLCCYVIAWPELVDDEPIQAGSLLYLEVGNLDVLENVQIDGEECQYITKGADHIYVSIPDAAGKKSHVKLISSTGEIDYAYAFKPNSEIVTVIWKGALELPTGENVGLLEDVDPAFLAADVQVGDIITFYLTTTGSNCEFTVGEGHWTKPNGVDWLIYGAWKESEGADFSKGQFSIVATQQLIDLATTQAWWGNIFMLQGSNVILSKVTNTHKVATETNLWKGNLVVTAEPQVQEYLLSDAGVELVAAEAEVGAKIRFYLTKTGATYWCDVFEGHWTNNNHPYIHIGDNGEDGRENYDIVANGYYEFELTQEILDAALKQSYWGGVFVIQGDGYTLTKITLYQ